MGLVVIMEYRFDTAVAFLNMKTVSMWFQLAQDRQDEIERDNKMLLGKLVKAMTTTRIDNWNDVDQIMYDTSFGFHQL